MTYAPGSCLSGSLPEPAVEEAVKRCKIIEMPVLHVPARLSG